MPELTPSDGTIKVKLITPLFQVMETTANKVLLPAQNGDILILPDRAPIFLSLRAGRMILYRTGQEAESYLISRGVCEFRRNLCPVLAWGGLENKIDPYLIAKQLENAEEALGQVRTSLGKNEVYSRIDFFRMVLKERHYNPQDHAHRTEKAGRLTPSLFGSTYVAHKKESTE